MSESRVPDGVEVGRRALRVGIVGCGRFGPRHALACLGTPDVELAGVHDIDESRAERLARDCGTTGFATLEQLQTAVDAVCVVVPPDAHDAVARSCLARGLHVLLEKPFGTSAARAASLRDLARRADRVLMAGYVERHHPALREAIRRAGRFEHMTVRRLSPPIAGLHPVDVVLDLMSHGIEYALRTTGESPLGIDAIGHDARGDRVSATLRFSEGRACRLLVDRAADAAERTVLFATGGERVQVDLLTGVVEGGGARVVLPLGNPLAVQVAEFARRIRYRVRDEDEIPGRVLSVAGAIVACRDHSGRAAA